MPSLRLGRSRTWPMLALTTYPEPRNLLIDLAFFGLSTMTSVRPRPAPAPAPFSGSGTDSAGRRDDAAFVADFAAGRFRVLVSVEGSERVADLADLRATISSHPVLPKLLQSPAPGGAGRRERESGVLFAIASATIPGTLRFGPV